MRTCAGGWCSIRETCSRYQPGTGFKPSGERLCAPGERSHFIPWVPVNYQGPPVIALPGPEKALPAPSVVGVAGA